MLIKVFLRFSPDDSVFTSFIIRSHKPYYRGEFKILIGGKGIIPIVIYEEVTKLRNNAIFSVDQCRLGFLQWCVTDMKSDQGF